MAFPAEVQDALLDLLVRRIDRAIFADELIGWATSALVDGMDTPALVILAGLAGDTSVYEADRWFQKALSELNVSLPDPEQLRRAYVASISRALLAGKVACPDALDRVHRYVVNPLGHPADLASWCYVWEGLNPGDFTDLGPDERERAARTLAEQWADRPVGLGF
jgi:hypothetical protein